jgi:hypothetical protein
MSNFQSGILEKTRLVSNILLVVLLAGNLFFSIQYIENTRQTEVAQDTQSITRLQISRFLKSFIDLVLSTQGTITYDDRVKLENDIRQIHDADLTKAWDTFIASKNGDQAQANAIKLMSLLTNKML